MSVEQTTPAYAGEEPRSGGYRPELRRTLGFKDLVFYGLIFMVPIAPFGIFGGVVPRRPVAWWPSRT